MMNGLVNAPGWVLDERKFLTEEEVDRIRVDALDCRNRLSSRVAWLEWFLVELAFESGLRVFEIVGLVCGDLVVSVDRCGVMVRRGKCGRSRFVRVRKMFAQECREFLVWKSSIGESVLTDEPVFHSVISGGHLTVRALQQMFARVCERNSVVGHSIHDCRHTYASFLYRSSGRNLRLVQRQLGHASIRTTEVYAHVFDQDADLAVEGLYS